MVGDTLGIFQPFRGRITGQGSRKNDAGGAGCRPTRAGPCEPALEAHRGAPGGNSYGFTLFEVVLVLFIVAMTFAIVVPRIGTGQKNMGDREFLQEFIGTLKRARLRAMSSGEIAVFRIRPAERTYDVVEPPQIPIPDNVDIYSDDLEEDPWTRDSVILFYPDGSTTGSDIEVKFDHERAFRISVHPLFGTVRYYKADSR